MGPIRTAHEPSEEPIVGAVANGPDPDPYPKRASAARSSYIPTLDGWRALAVGLVLGAHCYTMLINNGSKPAVLLANFFLHSGYGVDIFFGISGFLICTLLLREKEQTGSIQLGRFYVRRVFRILPPMYLYVAFLLLLAYRHVLPAFERRDILAVFFFFRNYIDASWYTRHFWSLSVEEHFYAVVPVFLLLLDRKWATRAALLLIPLCIGIRWFEFSHVALSTIPQYRTENRFDALLWGVVLALTMHSTAGREWLRKRLTPATTLIVLLCAVGLIAIASQSERRTVIAAVIPILIGCTVLHPHSLPGRFLELAPLRWVGRLSYSLYIWQMLFLVPDVRPLGALQAFPLALICPFVCAALSYYLLEKPMIRLGHRLAGSPTARPVRP